MKKKLVVPKFQNESEEAEFWAKLDLLEYFEPSDFKRGVVFPSLKRTKRLISIRLPEQLLIKVKHKASELHVPYFTFSVRCPKIVILCNKVEDCIDKLHL